MQTYGYASVSSCKIKTKMFHINIKNIKIKEKSLRIKHSEIRNIQDIIINTEISQLK